MSAPRQSGTVWAGESEVPCFVPAAGQSVNDAAAALGYRVLGRREQSSAVVAVILDEGSGAHFRCEVQS